MATDPSQSPRSSPAHERMREVFFEVCNLHGAERDAAVDRACAGDDALRRDVMRLLQRDATEYDLLADEAVDSGAAFGAARLVARAVGDDAGERLPSEIGGYRIVRRIGVGGMGSVYEAEQHEPRRIVALKTLQRWSASPSLIRRFRHEAHVLGRLQHPGIAQIFEARVHDPGDGSAAVPFFVMELIRGKPVTAFIRDGNLSIADRLQLFIRICNAVAYAHQIGVIHRDLKPDNILVDESGQPKILDFGIAKSTDSDRQVTTIQTDVGQLVGTLPYMSPEQVGDDSSRVDLRSDVYSLGVVLYEMLTDRLPYPVRDRSLPEAIRTIREESHTRLSAVDRGFRGDLETILSKALEKNADRRYQSVPQLSQDIQRYLDHEPISARPPSTFYQLSKFARRHKALVASTSAVIAVLALGIIGTTKYAIDANRSAREASERERAQRWSNYLARIDAAAAALGRNDVPAARHHLDQAPLEHRGWEWKHLERNLTQSAIEIECNAEIVDKASLLPGDTRVVAALADGTLATWDIESGRMLHAVSVAGGVWHVADAPAGALVAVATKGGEIAVFDMNVGVEIDRWSVREKRLTDVVQINDLAISPDGAMVVIGTPTEVVAWSRPEHRVAWRGGQTERPAQSGGFRHLTISADGSTIVASYPGAASRSTMWAWSLRSGEELGRCRPKDAVHGVAIHPKGTEIAIGSAVRDIMIAPVSTMRVGLELAGHTAGVRWIAYSPDGHSVASQSGDSTIRVRDVDDGRTLHVLHVPNGDATDGGLALSANGSRLVSRGARRIVVWDLPPEPSLVLRGHRSYVYTVAFSADGTLLASGPFQGDRIRLWDPRSGAALAEHAFAGRARSLRFMGDDRRLEIRGRRTQQWDTATGASLEVANDTTFASPDSAFVDEPESMLVDRKKRQASASEIDREDDVAASIGTFDDASNAAAGSLAATVVSGAAATAGASSVVEVWRAGANRPIASLAHESKAVSTALSPSQALLAVGCEDGSINVWDVVRGQRIAVLGRHVGRVYAVAFSPDGRRLASGGNDNALRLWDTATWDQVLERHEHSSYVHAVAFSPDGTQIATASGDMTVRVWDSLSVPERLAQTRAARATRDELRPRVTQLFERHGADETAKILRADRTLDDDRRGAALRVLLELTRPPVEARPRSSSSASATTTTGDATRRFPIVAATDVTVDDALVEEALRRAGSNRPEIERFLQYCDDEASGASERDPQKRIAARWLVANMPGKGCARFRLMTADGHEIPFDVSEHRNMAEAQARLETLQREHGALDFRVVSFTEDLVAITAAQLIENHELAFEAWRSAPWGASISFETFLERILPYRATNEPLDPNWRAAARDRMRPVLDMLRRSVGRDPTLAEASQATIKATKPWLKFRPLYYLHPDDQSWSEMCATGAGRCEDESNLALFAGRAAAIPLAGDSTPYWANRDNNHAWVAALDGDAATSRAAGKLAHRAAKVVRRGYATQPDSLGAVRRADDTVPGWLADPTARDVTDLYVDVADVTVSMRDAPAGERFAYLCVFNGGVWRPIHWCEAGHATQSFTSMGRGVLYLPAWYGKDGVRPAGAPLVVTADGAQRELLAGTETFTLAIGTSTDERTSRSGPASQVRLRVAADTSVELLVWDVDAGAWRTMGQRTATNDEGATFEDVPVGGLYRLRSVGDRDLDRPFTIENGEVVRW
ncbi:MAG: protein kinase [Phycisphaerae bacterium]|nr:protein kinase [Phycisphaerae bacterium]